MNFNRDKENTMIDDTTTELDAATDLANALEMYEGLFASESTTISNVSQYPGSDHVYVTLDNGDQFKIVVTKTNTAVQS